MQGPAKISYCLIGSLGYLEDVLPVLPDLVQDPKILRKAGVDADRGKPKKHDYDPSPKRECVETFSKF